MCHTRNDKISNDYLWKKINIIRIKEKMIKRLKWFVYI